VNEGFHAIGFTALADLPFVPEEASVPVISVLERGDPPSAVIVLVEFDTFDTDLDDVTRERHANLGMIYPDNTAYEERVISRVEIAQTGFDSIGVGARVALTISAITMFNEDRVFDQMIEEGLALGREAIVKTMPAPQFAASDCGGGDLANAKTVFKGVVAAMSSAREGMILAIADLGERLNTPFQDDLYEGTGGLEGPEDLKGAPKPVAIGSTFNSTPVYIGLVDLGDGEKPTYQSNSRRILGHSAVRERGVEMTQVFSTPGIGEWRDWSDDGCFQIGFTANGIITCDLHGDASLTDGYAGTTARVIERMLTAFGAKFSSSDLDAASFQILEARLPGEIGWRQGADPITAVDALEQLLSHTAVWLAGGRDGKLRVSVVDVLH